MDPTYIDLLFKAAAAAIALLGLFKGVREYHLQGSLKRAEFFLKKNEQFFEDERLVRIRMLIQSNDECLIDGSKVSRDDKRAYLTFFEEVALLYNSGLIKQDVARYMYGYYAIRCLESERFWSGLKKSEKQWGLFLAFADRLKQERSTRSFPDWFSLKF